MSPSVGKVVLTEYLIVLQNVLKTTYSAVYDTRYKYEGQFKGFLYIKT
jgi:hypothetical protein